MTAEVQDPEMEKSPDPFDLQELCSSLASLGSIGSLLPPGRTLSSFGQPGNPFKLNLVTGGPRKHGDDEEVLSDDADTEADGLEMSTNHSGEEALDQLCFNFVDMDDSTAEETVKRYSQFMNTHGDLGLVKNDPKFLEARKDVDSLVEYITKESPWKETKEDITADLKKLDNILQKLEFGSDGDFSEEEEEDAGMHLRPRREIKPANRFNSENSNNRRKNGGGNKNSTTKKKKTKKDAKGTPKKSGDDTITPKKSTGRRGRPKKNKSNEGIGKMRRMSITNSSAMTMGGGGYDFEMSTSVKELTSPMLQQKRRFTTKADFDSDKTSIVGIEGASSTSTAFTTSTNSQETTILDNLAEDSIPIRLSASRIPLTKLEDPSYYSKLGWVGIYSPDRRRRRLKLYLEKRKKRIWTKRIKYEVRKSFADSRLRVKGRFISKKDEDQLREIYLTLFL